MKVASGFSYEVFAYLFRHILEKEFPNYPLTDPSRFHLFQDHTSLYQTSQFKSMIQEQAEMATKYGLNLHSSNLTEELTDGICHTLIQERGLTRPGETFVGTDSHTGTLGVKNDYAIGIGATHFANVLITGEALVEVPKAISISLEGSLQPEVSAKDVMLYLLSLPFVKNGGSTSCVFEYKGKGLHTWDLGMQSTLTNLAIEGRAMTGIITELTPALRHHLTTVNHLSDEEITAQFVTADPGATYVEEFTINLDTVEPMIALPPDPTNASPISQLPKTAVDNVYIGSCTGGNYHDLAEAASVLKGQTIDPKVTLYIQPASRQILERAQKEGLVDILVSSGARLVGLGCGACCGYGPGGSKGVSVATINRNFPNRFGMEKGGKTLLTSAFSAAYAALHGSIGWK